MKTYIIAFVLAFMTSVATTPLIRRIALRFGLVDHPHPERKIHTSAIPRVGGLVILFAVLIPLASFYLYPEGLAIQAVREAPGLFAGLFLASGLVCVLGLIDDLRGMNAWVKLTGQVAIAMLMYFLEFRVTLLSNPFGSVIHLTWLSLPLTVLWYVVVMNAINLIDGLDGLASGLSLIISLVLFILALVTANGVLGVTTIILAGALIGFLLFNFNPARIFLGDSGSNLVGFLLATFSIMAHVKGQAAVALFLPVVALGVPFLDMMLSVLRRMASNQPLFTGDRKHIHHILLQRGFTQRTAALFLYAMGVGFAAIAVLMMFTTSTWINALLFVVLLLTVVLIMRFLGYHRMIWYSFTNRGLLESPTSRRLRGLLRDLMNQPPAERSWASFARALHHSGVTEVQVMDRDGLKSCALFSSLDPDHDTTESNFVSSSFRIRPAEGVVLELLFRWPAQQGQFAAMPNEEAYLRVAADFAESLPVLVDGDEPMKEK